jgi:hypothetical protein
MRVLQLAPPSASAITAHTFIDEEIRALGDAGVTCFTISDAESTPRRHEGVQILPVASPPDAMSIRRTLELIARHAALLPLSMASLSNARAVFHALRIESTAASAIVDHGIDLVHSHFGWPHGFGGLLAAAETRVPLVASLRGMDLLQRPDLSYG